MTDDGLTPTPTTLKFSLKYADAYTNDVTLDLRTFFFFFFGYFKIEYVV